MPRKTRIFIQGLPHIVRLRSNNVESLFREAGDYQYFLTSLDKALSRYQVKLYAYSLSRQQVLMLVEPVDKSGLGRLIQFIGRSYVPWFNHRYQRRGHLWESRYHSSPIEPKSYFLLVKKYIELLCKEEQGVGSYGEIPQTRLSTHANWRDLGETAETQMRNYLDFLCLPMAAAISNRIELAIEQNCLLSSSKFRRRMEEELACSLSPRQMGRPRKVEYHFVENWSWVEELAKNLLQRHCYQQIRIPLIEPIAVKSPHDYLFSADRCSISLSHQARFINDGTVGCLNIIAQHQGLQRKSKLWYANTTFRKHLPDDELWQPNSQLNVEVFGYRGIGIELEHISLQYRLFCALQLENHVELKVNSLGTEQELHAYRQAIRKYFQPYTQLLSQEESAWLAYTPEKLLNSDDALVKRLLVAAPEHRDFLSSKSLQRFNLLCEGLDRLGIPYTHDKLLITANDYCDFVAEWYGHWFSSTKLLCRGGRYDHFASHYVGQPLPACGFSLMLDSLIEFLKQTRHQNQPSPSLDVVLIPKQKHYHRHVLSLSQLLRRSFPQLSIANDFSGLKAATCQRNAEKQGANFIVQVGSLQEPFILKDKIHDHTSEITQEKLTALIAESLL